ncbi:hypothetical protein QAD02_004358 [Eretmocerus hayati]|uniref:Uncharacterized protein n=1 Tax=Eretmocerus hayati TaxID=131215 RepID=A0ACC2NPR6_9HYME|nr:hypothetical protein QAD02_004358 [Eretmocerus hayati]
MFAGPRGAVGGGSNGSRVDPWWNPGSFCPSVSSPGPPRIDGGPPLENEDLQYCSYQSNNNSRNSEAETRCFGTNNGTTTANSITSLGYHTVDSTRPNGVASCNGLDPYGLMQRSLDHQQQVNGNPSNLARVDSSQQRQLPSLLSAPASSSTQSPGPNSSDSLNGLPHNSYCSRIKQENGNLSDGRTTPSKNFSPSLLSSLLSASRISNKGYNRRSSSGEQHLDRNGSDHTVNNRGRDSGDLLLGSVKLEYPDASSDARADCIKTEEYILSDSPPELLLKQRASPSNISAIDMKFEPQSGRQTTPSHLNASGVEPPHSSQGNQGIVVGGGSPGEVVGVDSMLLSPWGAAGTEFLETHDTKQTAAGLEDAWDTLLLGSSVGAAAVQSLAELKPLPPFTGYTGHLSINGIQGHHYHTIASSAQRPGMQSTSPSPSNQEYYESSVTVDYINNIEDLAEIIGSAMADTTVPGSRNGGPNSNSDNGPTSEHDPEVSPRDWIDIAEWIDTACSPKSQETSSSSPYPQMYASAATTTPSNPNQPQQQHGSTLQSLLTHGYSPMLQQRLQQSCGETPSSTSPYPPVSPPGHVSTSCSPNHHLNSSFITPQHPRKRSRPSGGSHNPKKNPNGGITTSLPYGTEASLLGGKEKPVHRCSICNRGFLNKSNIKVHLRTHTGEKPFRCEVCGKAFRQKAHLIKHQQIHKRIGRD